MTMPNFLIIGAMKSGTTSLYNYLKQHPQIYMSPVKEPKFFALEGEKLYPGYQENQTFEWRGSGGLTRIEGIRDIEIYRQLFTEVSQEKAIGEASPLYIYIPKAVERIKYYIPEAKLIAILRHPVDRAYSHFINWVQRELEPYNSTFLQVLEEEEWRIQNNWSPLFHYKHRGFYYIQLQRFFSAFPGDKIRVYLYEDLQETPLNLVQDIFRFLNVDDSFIPNLQNKSNVSKIPKNKRFHKLITQANPMKTILKPFVPKRMRDRLKTNLQAKNMIKPKLSPELRKQLIEDYRDDIIKLQDLIHRDLSPWLES
ncbi:sulfotransferase family protein [Coleofasciculus chthonoplastes]|uniref:sulfotransferase family protein n=1 Tax=Coleofasciculus chthonoplastes TaxID=64178 RepID=UPI003303EB54